MSEVVMIVDENETVSSDDVKKPKKPVNGRMKTAKTEITKIYEVRAERNKQFKTNEIFIKSCEMAGIPVTDRQVSKWANGKGKALGFKKKAAEAIKTSTN